MATERVPEPLITKLISIGKQCGLQVIFIIANSHNYVSRFHQSPPQDYAAFLLSDCTLNWTVVTAFLEQSKSVIMLIIISLIKWVLCSVWCGRCILLWCVCAGVRVGNDDCAAGGRRCAELAFHVHRQLASRALYSELEKRDRFAWTHSPEVRDCFFRNNDCHCFSSCLFVL